VTARHWIPPWALAFALLAHGASWGLLLAAARWAAPSATSPAAIAWIHVVALGWFTVAALAILLHVIPGSTDLRWRGGDVARAGIAVLIAGVIAFTAAWFASLHAVAPAAALVALGLALYLWSALRTLAEGKTLQRRERAISRALSTTLEILALVALLGLLMALAVSGDASPLLLVRLPAAHATLALFGWLTLLVFGISARTMDPICGLRSVYPKLHIVVGTSMLPGSLLLALGLGLGAPVVAWSGALLVVVACLTYGFDIVTILQRATVTHRPPQAFVAASIFWLLVSLALGAGTMLGKPWGDAFVFTILIGWVGQMVNAHMLHIGVRTVSTLYRGDDDETRPGELLDVRLSWAAFALMQFATLLCALGLTLLDRSATFAGALAGAAGWCALVANLATAVRRSRRPAPYSPTGT
jgi:hypothetical protein